MEGTEMAYTLVLRLVSTEGKGSIAGFSKDPAWPGWIPLQSFSWGVSSSPHGVASGASSLKQKDATDVYLSAKMSDFDVTSLLKWVAAGEPASAQINFVSPGSGKNSSAFIFSDVLVASYSHSGENVGFTLNFKEVQQFFFAMSYP